ncbi:conserved hypothetical protein [Agrobacterium genomosp. 5 str. CFBP 6626]|nr:conserved hypothetical protein [Agrobacterium genomosp. 5 str. CFBP 6626]
MRYAFFNGARERRWRYGAGDRISNRERAYRSALYKRAHSQYERGNATGQMAEMACIGCPGDIRTYWFRADAGSFISERR